MRQLTPLGGQLSLTSGPRQGVKIGLNYSFWGVFGSPKAPVAWERAPGAYLVVGACCVGFKWYFSVKMARWSTPRVPFRGTRGVFWGAREITRKPKRTVLKPEPAPGPSGCHASTYPRHHTPNTAPFFHLKKATFWRSPPVI